jgi:circadian clock protein KaiC
MRSIGIDLAPFVKKGLLIIQAERSTSYGLETHLVSVHRIIDQFKPDVAILDSISSLMNIGEPAEVRSTLVRLVDYLKMRKVTSLFTDLKHTENPQQSSLISSMVDTWIILEDVESNGEKNRILRLVKSRGMDHSNQIREFLITNEGIKLVEPYIGPAGVLTGSARYAQEAREKAEGAALSEEQQRLETQLKNQRSALAAQMKMSRLESKSKEADLERRIAEGIRREKSLIRDKERMKVARTSGRQEGSL